jgi:hypothetical protein
MSTELWKATEEYEVDQTDVKHILYNYEYRLVIPHTKDDQMTFMG